MTQKLKIKSPIIHLSQAHLNFLSTCPPKFQNVYLDQLVSLPNSQEQEKVTWGNQFHLLMQQRELGLPIDSLLAGDEQLQKAIAALVKENPLLKTQQSNGWREAEHPRSLIFQDYLLTVIYDLLIAQENKADIIDWKTYLQPRNQMKLANNWQTRLYMYVLAETSRYEPEQISMTYWFIKLPHSPQHITFNYHSKHHEQTRKDLTTLLNKLDTWLADYLHNEICFPHFPNCHQTCPFAKKLLSSEHIPPIDDKFITQNWRESIANIEEIPM